VSQARFAYAQTRLQARHGQRPGEADWRRLASTGDLANYLTAARRTPLRPWIEGIPSVETSHGLESHLHQQFRRYVEDVAHWLPVEWRASITWIGHLADLPALQYLLQTGTKPDWMQDDFGLGEIAGDSTVTFLDKLPGSSHAYLGRALQDGIPLYDAWFNQWQRIWPAKSGLHSGLVQLGRLVRQHLQEEQTATLPAAGNAPEALATSLGAAFRRHSFKPAAACAHLGLVALDLERLRGELVQRALFEETTAVQS
jgi:hypothetical protein